MGFDYSNPKHIALALLVLAAVVTGIVLLSRWYDGSFPALNHEEANRQCGACVYETCPLETNVGLFNSALAEVKKIDHVTKCTRLNKLLACTTGDGGCVRQCKQLLNYEQELWDPSKFSQYGC